MTDSSILLKWGTIKGWDSLNEESVEILNKYIELGASMSCALQRDSSDQRDLLVKLIETHDGDIMNDWDGVEYSKEEAIKYIRNYRS